TARDITEIETPLAIVWALAAKSGGGKKQKRLKPKPTTLWADNAAIAALDAAMSGALSQHATDTEHSITANSCMYLPSTLGTSHVQSIAVLGMTTLSPATVRAY